MDFIICINDNHPSLAGHFPGNPVVPGVVLLEQVELKLAEQYPSLDIISLIQAKFSLPVLPNHSLTLSFQADKLSSHQVIQFVAKNQAQEKVFFGKLKIAEKQD